MMIYHRPHYPLHPLLPLLPIPLPPSLVVRGAGQLLGQPGPARPETGSMFADSHLAPVQRHHWINTIVGLIDSVWSLTPEELYPTIRVVNGLLDQIAIPDRGAPSEVPAPLALEVDGGFYSLQLNAPYDSGVPRPVRAVTADDLQYPIEIWCSSFTHLFTAAYPDLDPIERVYLTKGFLDLLASLGIPERAPFYIPEDVARTAHRG